MSVQRSEIYFVNLNPVQGREQAGERPVLVLSVDAINQLPLVVTVVVGTKGTNITKNYPTNVRCLPEETGSFIFYKNLQQLPKSTRCFKPIVSILKQP
ncbi:type II toxin-antitoxin system PemK/MazF family toxin [Dolichospermum circinale]|jgi:mRNA interferase MazF|uniref:type II toxin-antitoxin system PemK/MazF family toxin n=1 Tax=Dolichospermum circinale TaxID=109265 RepID=UPI0023304B9C|nr:type II toxin-antitoxin system PemK/MazF family toxin [Dolichospermum circinale]MDB9448883.1 type II toxin-antitoxin system PemK/MazF family toxin [Dolichospermum circinale CS-547]